MNKLIEVLAEQWLYDISVLSQGWVIFLVIPAFLYFVFMLIKWTVLTIPLWLPAAIVLNIWKSK